MKWFHSKPRNRRFRNDFRVYDARVRSRMESRRQLRTLGMALAVALVAGGVAWGLWAGFRTSARRLFAENDAFQLRDIAVDNAGDILKQDQVIGYLRLQRGVNLLALDLSQMRRDLELLPVVDRAEVSRELPSRLIIRITERVPLANISSAVPGTHYQIDRAGVVVNLLPLCRGSDPMRQRLETLPEIVGAKVADLKIGRPVLSPEIYQALAMIQKLERGELGPGMEISSIDVSRQGMLVIRTAEESVITVSTVMMEQQLRRWGVILDDARRRSLRIATADLSLGRDVPVTFAANP